MFLPFLILPPRVLHPIPLPFASERVLPHPPIHPHQPYQPTTTSPSPTFTFPGASISTGLDTFSPTLPLRAKRAVLYYTYAGGFRPAHVCTLVGGSSLGSLKGPGLLILLVFLWSPYPLWVPQSFLKLFHKTLWSPYNVWLWVSASVSVSCWCSLSKNSYARHLSSSTTEYHE